VRTLFAAGLEQLVRTFLKEYLECISGRGVTNTAKSFVNSRYMRCVLVIRCDGETFTGVDGSILLQVLSLRARTHF